MAVEWFMRDGSGVSTHVDEEGVLLIHGKNDPPDWVKLPDESPVDPGRQLKVLGSRRAPCIICKREVTHFLLEANYGVCQCKPGCGYCFYRLMPAKTDG